MSVRNKYLFNFAASYSGGGAKRLYAYSRWFNSNGGAWFVINPRSAALQSEFPNNRFFVADQSRVRRLFDDCAYLRGVEREMGTPELYYAYGIPLYWRVGKINWFHLSNVLPLRTKGIPLSMIERGKAILLGRRIRAGFIHADVISAESDYSLSLIETGCPRKLFRSVNGSDDELTYFRDNGIEENKSDTAIILGTQRYKAMDDSVAVFAMLKKEYANLELLILGNPKYISRAQRSKPGVVICGILGRDEVIDCLRRAKFYLSTTYIENSYNAASEGIFIADESYISDIGPHRELLVNCPYSRVSVPGVSRQLLRVNRATLRADKLKTWDTVVVEMIERHHRAMRERY